MKTNPYFYSQPNHLTYRTAIAREQKQFIKIGFAVHLSAVISAERYRSDSGALKSAVLHFVFFMIIINKMQQSAKRLLLNSPTDRAFGNRRGKYKELGKKVPQAYRVYVEDTFLPCDAVIACIFSKEETGLYYYGARYLDLKYSRWLSGDPVLNEYIPQAPVNDEAKKLNENLPGMGGVFNVVNLHVYHYAGNNPIKYIDPDGREDGFPKNFKETVIYLQGKLVSTEVENFQLTRLLNIAKGFVDSNMAKLPEQESGWNLYKDDYGDCCFDRVQLIASILISEGVSVSYIKTIKPKGFNFHIAALVRIGYKSYVVDTIKIYTGATGITSPENWLKKQSPKDYEIIPASKNAKLIPNKHIKFWYDKSALPDENYDDFAARQIEYYIKTGDVEL